MHLSMRGHTVEIINLINGENNYYNCMQYFALKNRKIHTFNLL